MVFSLAISLWFDHASVTFAGKRNAPGLAFSVCSLSAYVGTKFRVTAGMIRN
jgi:hypothetical protein